MIVLSDNDVRGAVALLHRIVQSEWSDVAASLDLRFRTLEEMGLTEDSLDREIWERCQSHGALLVTADRSRRDGPESLGQIISELGDDNSLPVVTIGDPVRIMRDPHYASECAFMLIDFLSRLDELRGTQRLYLSPP